MEVNWWAVGLSIYVSLYALRMVQIHRVMSRSFSSMNDATFLGVARFFGGGSRRAVLRRFYVIAGLFTAVAVIPMLLRERSRFFISFAPDSFLRAIRDSISEG